jgi:hypothetical protein
MCGMSIEPDGNGSPSFRRKGFDYSVLTPELAQAAQEASTFILERVKQTVMNIVLIGMRLHAMKRDFRARILWTLGQAVRLECHHGGELPRRGRLAGRQILNN